MKHILFTLKECNSELLDDEFYVRDIVAHAAKICKSTLLSINSYKFMPQGVTCVAMLAESHISIHTWLRRVMQYVMYLLVVTIQIHNLLLTT